MTKKKAKAVGRAQLGFSLSQELKDQIKHTVARLNQQGADISVSTFIQRACVYYTNVITNNFEDEEEQ
jgi:hypothetical protein